jgi:hypothetical protein
MNALERAAQTGATVTVTRSTDGKTFTGTVKAHPTDPDYFSVQTGRRGRPAVVHLDDVEEVFFE